MFEGYFAQVDLEEKKYCFLCLLKDGKGYSMAPNTKKWMPSELAFKAPFDTTNYDEMTEDQALELVEEWGVSEEEFNSLPK